MGPTINISYVNWSLPWKWSQAQRQTLLDVFCETYPKEVIWYRTWRLSIIKIIYSKVRKHKEWFCCCCLVTDLVVSDSFVTLWTVAHQTPDHGISQARVLEWIASSFSRRSSQPKDQTPCSCHVSCIGGWILYHWTTWGSRNVYLSS